MREILIIFKESKSSSNKKINVSWRWLRLKRRKRRKRKIAFDDEQWARLVRTYVKRVKEKAKVLA